MPMTPHELVIEAKSQIKEVTTADAQALMTKRTIIDVREYNEFAAGHLPGAINVPRGVLEFQIGTIGECVDKARPYLIYCRTSGRAALSAVQLQKIGYTDLVSMAGGFEAWAREGRPVDQPAPVNFD